MPEINCNLPRFECLVRSEFLYNFERGQGQFVKGICHAVTSLANRALGFHVLLENGAHIGRLPIHAIVRSETAPPLDIEKPWMLQTWDCFSYHVAAIEFDYLAEMRCRVVLPDKKTYGGQYMVTLDYYGSDISESAGENGWKQHHLLSLDNGWLAAVPNNRVCWFDPAFTTPFREPPDYRTMSREWKCEDGMKWRTENDGRMFYGISEL